MIALRLDPCDQAGRYRVPNEFKRTLPCGANDRGQLRRGGGTGDLDIARHHGLRVIDFAADGNRDAVIFLESFALTL